VVKKANAPLSAKCPEFEEIKPYYGNMTRIPDKGITAMAFNCLNLPS